MMFELELRAKILDKEFFLKKLNEFGCVLSDEVCQEDLIYTHDKVSPIVRIRCENNCNILTVKTFQENRNTAKEYEVVFDNYENMKEILDQFNFNKPIKLTKIRRTTILGDFSLMFDFISELGYFVEIESLKNEKTNEQSIYQAMKSFLLVLGIPESSITGKKYFEMLMDIRNSGLDTINIGTN